VSPRYAGGGVRGLASELPIQEVTCEFGGCPGFPDPPSG
jgi:hypothetical protein